jgi:hypothetical protein
MKFPLWENKVRRDAEVGLLGDSAALAAFA